ncbi:MAG: transglutaminase family protein [Verrucomicrobiota bacterium]|nr:transglutaminase family protein [Verrucomicrobiota bacterium]
MLYRLSHVTSYEYYEPVSISHHALRLQPRQFSFQECRAHQITLDPAPSSEHFFTDYHGNHVATVTIESAHRQLTIRSAGVMEIFPRQRVQPLETPAWEQVRDLSRGGQLGAALEASEFLFDSHYIRTGDDFADYAKTSFTKGRPILDAALELTARIYKEFTFDPKVTTIATPLGEVLQKRRGVCQDFAHLQIACLRSLGLAARYVSGYIETIPPPGKSKLAGADASHAWVSIFCHGYGWIDLDPTNNLIPSTQHITVALGRDYADVSPVRGVIVGSGEHELKVAVDMEPIADDARPSESRPSQ